MSDFLTAGKTALEGENYWAALSLALMLPSICSRIAYKNNVKYYNPNKKKQWEDKACYVDWVNENCKPTSFLWYVFKQVGKNIGEILYQLRCGALHEGSIIITEDKEVKVYFSINSCGVTEFSEFLLLDISSVCNGIFQMVESWHADNNAEDFDTIFFFNMKDYDDRLLYDGLCCRDRQEKLLEDFDSRRASEGGNF